MTGELAQLVERCDRTAEVRGSNPLFSTDLRGLMHTHVRRKRSALLIGLGMVVICAVVARPSSLLTFTLLTLASGVRQGRSQRL